MEYKINKNIIKFENNIFNLSGFDSTESWVIVNVFIIACIFDWLIIKYG